MREYDDDTEHCQRCGSTYYPVVWAAENDLWNEVMGSSAGLLCPRCFTVECNAKGIYPFFVAHREHVVVGKLEAERDRYREGLRKTLVVLEALSFNGVTAHLVFPEEYALFENLGAPLEGTDQDSDVVLRKARAQHNRKVHAPEGTDRG